jgi:hypothetical protein
VVKNTLSEIEIENLKKITYSKMLKSFGEPEPLV